MFSCFKSLIAYSLSYVLGTVSRHLLPRSLSVCPVAGSALHTYNTIQRHGPNNAAHLGSQLATSHRYSLLLLPWCTLQFTVNVHFQTYSWNYNPWGRSQWTDVKKRLRIAWDENLASVKILVRLKAPYVSRKNADNQHILMSVRYHVTNMKMKYLTEIELNAFWCGDLAAATLCGSTIR